MKYLIVTLLGALIMFSPVGSFAESDVADMETDVQHVDDKDKVKDARKHVKKKHKSAHDKVKNARKHVKKKHK